MNSEGCRSPSRVCGMTIAAGGWNIQGNMVGIGGAVEIGLMTSHTGIGCVVIVTARVTAVAIG